MRGDVVRRVEALAVVRLGDHRDRSVVLVADDAVRQVLARQLAALEVERVAVGVVRRLPEHGHPIVVFDPAQDPVVGDVAEDEVASLHAPRRALGPQRAGPQPLDRRVGLDVVVEARIDGEDVGIAEVGGRCRVRSEIARRNAHRRRRPRWRLRGLARGVGGGDRGAGRSAEGLEKRPPRDWMLHGPRLSPNRQVHLDSMTTTRLEAFSDGVFAVIITIMVLELKVPHGTDWEALSPLMPVFLTYVLSFVFLGIYWNNHHHMMHLTQHVTGGIMWANLHLLFWLSLTPFVTGWMGENHFEPLPTAIYGGVLLCAAIAYTLLQMLIIRHEGPDCALAQAVKHDVKGKISVVMYATAIPFAFINQVISTSLYVAVAMLWLAPDRRIEVRHERER